MTKTNLTAKAYKYKMLPNYKQQKFLQEAFGCARFVYNWGLNRKIQAYKKDKTSLSAYDLGKELTILKKQPNYEWLDNMAIKPLQFALKNMDAAFTRFFREKKGFPKFKSKHKNKPSAQFIEAIKFDFKQWKVKVPKIGWINICKSREFDLNNKIGTLTVSQDKCGTYWCSILVYDVEKQPKAKVDFNTSVGIDLGIKDFATLSDGTKFDNHKFYDKNHKKLKIVQRKFARTVKGSHRHETARLKVNKVYRRITNSRNDFLHKLSTYLIHKYDTICLENLNVEGMLKNHNLAKSIQDVSWGEFVRQLTYKCDWYGKNVVFIGRYEPSSKTCNNCGYINRGLRLSDRVWVCPECGVELDRDVNAAINIRQMALEKQNLIGL